MIRQVEITLSPYPRGFHLVTGEVLSKLPELPESGMLNLFIKHTSAGITINENADPTVRLDFETVFNQLVPEGHRNYVHTLEGPDDLPAHTHAATESPTVEVRATTDDGNQGGPGAANRLGAAKLTQGGQDVNLYVNSGPNTQLGGLGPSGSISVALTGGSTAHANRQPYQALNYIICLNGIYPSRP